MGYAQAFINRPANITQYSASDCVGGLVCLKGIGLPNQDIIVTKLLFQLGIASVPAGMTSFRARFYRGAPPSQIADNAAWSVPLADMPFVQGYADLGTPADVGASLESQLDQANTPLRCDKRGDVYVYVVTNGIETPAANSEQYILSAWAVPV